MRFVLDLPPMQTSQKVEQVKAYFSAVENPHNSTNYFNVRCCFMFTENAGLLGTGAQDGHLYFHTAPELCIKQRMAVLCMPYSARNFGLLLLKTETGTLQC